MDKQKKRLASQVVSMLNNEPSHKKQRRSEKFYFPDENKIFCVNDIQHLCSKSTYFDALFTHEDMIERNEHGFIVMDRKYDDFAQVMDFIAKGSFDESDVCKYSSELQFYGVHDIELKFKMDCILVFTSAPSGAWYIQGQNLDRKAMEDIFALTTMPPHVDVFSTEKALRDKEFLTSIGGCELLYNKNGGISGVHTKFVAGRVDFSENDMIIIITSAQIDGWEVTLRESMLSHRCRHVVMKKTYHRRILLK